MANFDACLDFTLRFEGGYVDNPHDPGGPTNMGITLPVLSHALGRRATHADIMHISRQTAADIYRKSYWALVDGDHLPAGVDLMAFDIAVNMGVGRAHQLMKQTQSLSPTARIKALDRLRCGFWRALPTFRVFGRGWLRREAACLAAAQTMNAVAQA